MRGASVDAGCGCGCRVQAQGVECGCGVRVRVRGAECGCGCGCRVQGVGCGCVTTPFTREGLQTVARWTRLTSDPKRNRSRAVSVESPEDRGPANIHHRVWHLPDV